MTPLDVQRRPPLVIYLFFFRPAIARSSPPPPRPHSPLSLISPLTSRAPFQIIASLDEDPAAQSKQLTLRLQQIAAALENKVTDL